MRKTSVYLSDDEAEGLQRVSATTGRAQAELIREGVRTVIAEAESQPRAFRSLGKGRGGGKPFTAWKPQDLYEKVMRTR
jgi:predicted DNA-binding protein